MKSFFYALFLVMALACAGDDSENDQASDLRVIEDLEEEIIELVDISNCSENNECKFIAFGSKPCGGPWSYLVYSTSVDEDTLIEKVEEYNRLQNLYNVQYGIISDCALVNPPSAVSCENGKCVAII